MGFFLGFGSIDFLVHYSRFGPDEKKHCTDRFSGHLPDSIRSVVRTASGRLDCIRVRSGEPRILESFFFDTRRFVSPLARWFLLSLFFSRSVFPSLHRARSLRTLSVAVTGMERDRVITGREPTTIGFRRAELRAPAGHSCRNRRSRSRDARRSIPAPTFWIASRLFHSELRRSRHPSPENPLLTPRVSAASSPLAPIFAGRLPASLWV